MGMLPILFSGAEPFEQIVNTPSTEVPQGDKILIVTKKFYYFNHT